MHLNAVTSIYTLCQLGGPQPSLCDSLHWESGKHTCPTLFVVNTVQPVLFTQVMNISWTL